MDGQVLSIDTARQQRRATVADLASLHPGTRWSLPYSPAAHRRNRRTGGTTCGLAGPLVLATPDAPSCGLCGAA